MNKDTELKQTREKLVAPVVDSLASVVAILDKALARAGRALTSYEKYELHLARVYFINNYHEFDHGLTQKLIECLPGKGIGALNLAPTQLEELLQKCHQKKQPFASALDFSVLKKERINQLLPKYLMLLNSVGNEKGLEYYINKYESITTKVFLELQHKQSPEFCRAAVKHNSALILKSMGLSEQEKIQWLEDDKEKVKPIFQLQCEETIELYRKDGQAIIDKKVLERALNIYADFFIQDMKKAISEGASEERKRKIYELYEEPFSKHFNVWDIMALKDESVLHGVLKLKMKRNNGYIINSAQKIYGDIVSEYSMDNKAVGAKEISLFADKYKNIIFDMPCVKRDRGVDFKESYVSFLFKNSHYACLEFVPMDKVRGMEKLMMASGAIMELHYEPKESWQLKVLNKLDLIDVQEVWDNLLGDDDPYDRTFNDEIIAKMDAFIMKKKLDEQLSHGAGALSRMHKI